MGKDLECDFGWIASSFPFILSIVASLADGCKIAEGSRFEKGLQFRRHVWVVNQLRL